MEKTIGSTQVLLVPHEQAATRPDWKLREVEVGRCSSPVLEFREERQFVTEMRLETREVPQQVVCNESKPVTVTDPVTGHCRTEYHSCPVVKTVMVKVYETVPKQREVIVRVPCLKPAEVVIKKLCLDPVTVPVIERRFTPLITTNTLTVPPCPPLPCLPPVHP